MNGVDIRQLGINNYHKMIACVMQDDKLFSGSIRDNICGFSHEVDDAWMEACARACYLHDVLIRMPMGYETLIGELGEGLSGGKSNACSSPGQSTKNRLFCSWMRPPARWIRRAKRS